MKKVIYKRFLSAATFVLRHDDNNLFENPFTDFADVFVYYNKKCIVIKPHDKKLDEFMGRTGARESKRVCDTIPIKKLNSSICFSIPDMMIDRLYVDEMFKIIFDFDQNVIFITEAKEGEWTQNAKDKKGRILLKPVKSSEADMYEKKKIIIDNYTFENDLFFNDYYKILTLIYEYGDSITQKNIGQLCNISRQTVMLKTNELCEKGYITNNYKVTEKGEKIIKNTNFCS